VKSGDYIATHVCDIGFDWRFNLVHTAHYGMNAVSQSIVLPLMLHKHALSVIEADYQSWHVSFVSQD